jgi:electron transport complex protein RnfB
VEQIACRTGRDQTSTGLLLEEMVRKGLIRVVDEGEGCKFGLMPWVVGVYEMQLGRLDEELVRLIEEYNLGAAFQWAEVLTTLPSIHKVIPVEKSIPFEVQIFPYEQAFALLDNAKSFGVRKCICRVHRGLAGEPCKYPLETCLVFAQAEGVFDDDPDTRPVTKDEAIRILRETEEVGLIHSSANIREGHEYICNCCTCCCGFMRSLHMFGLENSVAKSDFHATADSDQCTGCGTYVKRCQFGVPTLVDNVSHVDQRRCVGCGQCVTTCPSGAMTLVRRPKDQISPTPRDTEEWMIKRAKSRGISTQELEGLNLSLFSNARKRILGRHERER